MIDFFFNLNELKLQKSLEIYLEKIKIKSKQANFHWKMFTETFFWSKISRGIFSGDVSLQTKLSKKKKKKIQEFT